MPSATDARPLPSLGLPVSGWGTNQPGSSVTRNTRREKLGLWSAVALQQHFALTGGQGGLPLPSRGASSTTYTATQRSYLRATEHDNDDAAEYGVHGDVRSHLGMAPSLPGRRHKPTLAQRMGLVPASPPPPTADHWRATVHRAMLREQQQQTGHFRTGGSRSAVGSVCVICQMSYASTSEEGQVILSCSHVFHAQCFRSFERCVRSQQRADAAGVAEMVAPLACPVCRTQHYHKRVFFEGKALAQRAAIVKIQSLIRGHLARRAYTQQRLLADPIFRTHYIQERLTRLSAAWKNFCERQERNREALLIALEAQHQAARAAGLNDEVWAELWRKATHAHGNTNPIPSTGGVAASPKSAATSVASSPHPVQCPICLELIYSHFFPKYCSNSSTIDRMQTLTGESAVAAMRAAYEARRAAKRAVSGKRKKSNKALGALPVSTALSASSTKHPTILMTSDEEVVPKGEESPTSAAKAARPSRGSRSKACATAKPQTLRTRSPRPKGKSTQDSPSSSAVPDPCLTTTDARLPPRSGVLLSCGHCFHAACIRCYEEYNERNAVERNERDGCGAAIIANRCPICRSGYAKHPM